MTTERSEQAGPELVSAIRKILDAEAANGFRNKAVIGGVDRFLIRLRAQANAEPALKRLNSHGLLSVGYAELHAGQRERWADEVRRFLGDAKPAARPPKRSAPPPEPPPAAPPARNPLDLPLTALRSVNRPQAAAIKKMLIRRRMLTHPGEPNVGDLVYLFPRRHEDRRERTAVAQLRVGEEQTIEAVLWEAYEARLGRGGRIKATEAVVGDDTGNIRVIWWGNPWIAQQLRRAIAATAHTPSGVPRIVLSGKVTLFQGKKQMESPEWELAGSAATPGLHTAGLVPFYPWAVISETKRIPDKKMREIVREALDNAKKGVSDPLPDAVREDVDLLTLAEAIEHYHYPASEDAKEQARRRLAFDELLPVRLRLGMEHNYVSNQQGIALSAFPPLVESFIASLPFELTQGQRDALDEAMQDVSSGGRPMNRLLQGDVGSGKTVVAVAMLLAAVAGGFQGAMMAPTEVLAEQHFFNLRRLLSGPEHSLENPDWFSAVLNGREEPVAVALLTGSTRAGRRREILRMAEDGSLDLLIGTHALIQKQVALPNLALAVGDEQHRFGTLQRAALRGKSALGEPHLLLMSATPIPRTLALMREGELEISTIDELPAGRQEILTHSVPLSRAVDAENYLLAQVREGRQCFIVYPRIDDADDRFSGIDDADDEAAGDDVADENSDLIPEPAALPPLTAVAEYERLRSTTLADARVGLLHGRMPLPEKQAVMDAFRAGELDVLVSTPVIEVGIDVPNATVMMVRSPARFGLAQLHQLRGRVGRGAHQSYCFLVSESENETVQRLSDVRQRRVANGDDWREVEQWFRAALKRTEAGRERLNVLVRTNDGFEIADADLEMRRGDDFFGTRQSGTRAGMARLSDRDLIDAAREHAGHILAADPELNTLTGLRAAVDRLTAAVTHEMA